MDFAMTKLLMLLLDQGRPDNNTAALTTASDRTFAAAKDECVTSRPQRPSKG